MFRHLFKRQARCPSPPSVAAGLRLYAIGDIHGRVDLLKRLHVLIQDDASSNSEAAQKVVVYLGDYIDRGLESRTVIDLLLDDPLAGFEVVHLKGNHEDALLRFMDDASFEIGRASCRERV